MSQKTLSEKKQAILDKILSNNPSKGSIVLDLPSKDRFYQKIDPSNPITLRPLNWEDEKALAEMTEDNPANLLIGRCIENVPVGSLLECDRSYILVKLREISVGPSYDARVTCPHCGKVGEVEVDTREFRRMEIPDDLEDPRTITLSSCDVEVSVRFPRAFEDKYTQEPSVFIDNTWRFIDSVADSSDPEIIAAFVKQLNLRDSQTLRTNILGDYGIDTKFIYNCSECSKETLLGVPIGPDFFSAT